MDERGVRSAGWVRRLLRMRRSIRFGRFGCDDAMRVAVLAGLEKAVVLLHPNEQKRSCFARCPHLKIEIWGSRLYG